MIHLVDAGHRSQTLKSLTLAQVVYTKQDKQTTSFRLSQLPFNSNDRLSNVCSHLDCVLFQTQNETHNELRRTFVKLLAMSQQFVREVNDNEVRPLFANSRPADSLECVACVISQVSVVSLRDVARCTSRLFPWYGMTRGGSWCDMMAHGGMAFRFLDHREGADLEQNFADSMLLALAYVLQPWRLTDAQLCAQSCSHCYYYRLEYHQRNEYVRRVVEIFPSRPGHVCYCIPFVVTRAGTRPNTECSVTLMLS